MGGAGERNELWALERPPASTRTSVGDSITPDDDWTLVASVWVGVHTLTDIEAVRAKTIERQTTHRLVMLFRDDIQTTWRFRKGSRRLYITGMRDPNSRRQELEVSCTEVRGG